VGAEHIRLLSELRRGDGAAFGGKSASLGELIEAGIPVPPGFALATSAFQAFLEEASLGTRIAAELAEVDPDDLATLRAASAAIAEAFHGASLPQSVDAQVVAAYEALGDDEAPVAVRSSALGEDSAEATFAGQQQTYLWVRGIDPVREAVRRCWASLYSPEAVSYRARMAAESPAAMGVTVQRMVDAEVSGVMFTCNPVSGDPSTVAVNASWGLGEAVVGGEVTPDEYRVSKVTRELLHRSIGSKRVLYVPDADGGGTVPADVPAERQEQACLADEQLQALLEVARRVERHFGCHQDVEWAIGRDGGLFVLQSRPVTVPGKRPEAPAKSAMDLVMNTFGARTDRS
jgi:pyruvate,water dikinase